MEIVSGQIIDDSIYLALYLLKKVKNLQNFKHPYLNFIRLAL